MTRSRRSTMSDGHAAVRRIASAALALGFFLALPKSEASAAIALAKNVGTNASQSSGTSLALSLTAGVAAGNTVIVTFAMDPATCSAGTCSGPVTCADSKGNTYSKDADVANGSSTSGARTVIFSAPVTTALVSTDTITVTHPSATARAMSVSEFSGLATTAALDKTASATNSSGTPSSGSTAT